jgi:cytochrome c oxidase subunit 2
MARHAISQLARLARRLPVLAPVLLLAGCFTDTRQSTIFPETDTGRVIQHVYALVTWIDLAIFVFVFALLVWAVWKYRERKGQPAGLPAQVHGSQTMELVWTIIPAVILVFIAVPTWEGIFRAAAPPGQNAITIQAVGHQWWWEFRYVGEKVVTANELHLPINRPAVIDTTSKDVIHSFWVPKLAGKIDAMPGKQNMVWFTPEKAGTYYGQCAEFCGTSHANMRFKVVVETEEQFKAWLERIQAPPKAETAEAKEGEVLFGQKGCIACHTITGRADAQGQIGPNLTNLKDRTTIASALLDNTPQNLAHWIRAPREIKPGALMVLPLPVSEPESMKLAAYLTSAPGAVAAAPAGQAMAAPAAPAGANPAVALMQAKICWTCHIISDVPNAKGTVGPDLTHLMARPKIVAGMLDNTPANLKKWLKNPPGVKPGTAMPNLGLSDAEIDALVNHLQTYK